MVIGRQPHQQLVGVVLCDCTLAGKDEVETRRHHVALALLGDAIIRAAVTHGMLRHYQSLFFSNQNLTERISIVVSNETLAGVSEQIGLTPLTRKCRSEWEDATTLETLVGAIAQERGNEAAIAFATRVLKSALTKSFALTREALMSSHNLLGKLCARLFGAQPTYAFRPVAERELGVEGDTVAEIKIRGETIAAAAGEGKHHAQQNAIAQAIQYLNQKHGSRR